MIWYVDTLLCTICNWEVIAELRYDRDMRKKYEKEKKEKIK